MKKIIAIFSLFILVGSANGQQDPLYGQYIFNSSIINPAQAGVQDLNQVGLLARRQWLGMEGAPTTNSFFINTRLPKNLGFAGGIYNDKIGPIRDLTIQADIATHIQINSDWTFSGGIRAMGSNIQANLSTLQVNQTGDPNFSTNFNSGTYLNMGAGVLFYNEKHFIGASMPRIFSRTIEAGNSTIGRFQSHLFLYGGSNFEINEDFTFNPSVLFKTTTDAPLQFDLNFMFDYKDILDVGPLLRSKDAIGFLVGYKVNSQFYLGYLYEYPIGKINLISRQTHEVSLRMYWQSQYKKRVKSPRYFM